MKTDQSFTKGVGTAWLTVSNTAGCPVSGGHLRLPARVPRLPNPVPNCAFKAWRSIVPAENHQARCRGEVAGRGVGYGCLSALPRVAIFSCNSPKGGKHTCTGGLYLDAVLFLGTSRRSGARVHFTRAWHAYEKGDGLCGAALFWACSLLSHP